MTDPFAWRHVTTGPCTGCGARTTRYGPHGRPHCDDCLPAGEWLATHHLTQPPNETEPAMDQDHNPEPDRIADVIQAFRDPPGLFTAATAPDPPEAA
jgi:hypothetical protein